MFDRHLPALTRARARRPSRAGGVPRVSAQRTLWSMILREMSTSYGRSWGGYLWAIAGPVGGILMMTMVFSLVLRKPPIGTNFVIFYATGYVPFSYFNTLNKSMAQSVTGSRALLAYPAVTVIDALVSKMLVIALTEIVVAYLIFSFALLTQETRTDPQIFQIALSLLMATALGFGVGTINCVLFAAFPEWQMIWGILTRPLFILSCVFFIYDRVPKPFDEWLWYNPVVHIIGQMRKGFYHSYAGDYVSPAYVFGVSAVLTIIGLALLVRYHREVISEW